MKKFRRMILITVVVVNLWFIDVTDIEFEKAVKEWDEEMFSANAFHAYNWYCGGSREIVFRWLNQGNRLLNFQTSNYSLIYSFGAELYSNRWEQSCGSYYLSKQGEKSYRLGLEKKKLFFMLYSWILKT